MNPWRTLKSTEIYKNNWIRLIENKVINPAGNDGIYSVVDFRNLAIGIIPLDDELNTWIVGQYRYPLHLYSWEIPEGGGDPSLDPVVSARKELKEECGLTAKRYIPILTMHLSNSATNERAEVFVATGLTAGVSSPEETEQLEIRKIPFAELHNMVMNGLITDAISVAATLKLKLLMDKGWDPLSDSALPEIPA